ncbi:uncharacterized protein LOC101852673, partial [Aplysia californica]|uniref:Uncharacterized protein LOC101852673 n=1 Tax=Aplysia californica TaxID=6500 RepID=A0ABM0ZV37_APLCA
MLHTALGRRSLLLFFLCVVLALLECLRGEVFSSVSKVRALIQHEAQLLKHLERVVEISEKLQEEPDRLLNLRRSLKCLKERHDSHKAVPCLGENPVFAFSYIRRLVRDWALVTSTGNKSSDNSVLTDNLRRMREAISRWHRWPTEADVYGAGLSLLRLSSIYKLFPHSHPPKRVQEEACPHHAISDYFQSLPNRQYNLINYDWNFSSPLLYHSELKGLSRFGWLRKLPLGVCGAKHNNNPTIERRDNKCKPSNNWLEVDDFVAVAQSAVNNSLHKEALSWISLAQKSWEVGSGSDLFEQSSSIKDLRRKVEQALNKQKDDSQSHLFKEYERLCRESLSQKQTPVTYSGGPTLTCTWRHVWPWVRYKMELMHVTPPIYRFYDVISDSEIRHLIHLSEDRLLPSQLPDYKSTRNRKSHVRV